MKNFFKILGIISMVLVIGFSMVSCGDDDDGGGSGEEIPSAYQNTTWKSSGEGIKINKTDFSQYPLESEKAGNTYNVTEITDKSDYWLLEGSDIDGWFVHYLYLKKDGSAVFFYRGSDGPSYDPETYEWDEYSKE